MFFFPSLSDTSIVIFRIETILLGAILPCMLKTAWNIIFVMREIPETGTSTQFVEYTSPPNPFPGYGASRLRTVTRYYCSLTCDVRSKIPWVLFLLGYVSLNTWCVVYVHVPYRKWQVILFDCNLVCTLVIQYILDNLSVLNLWINDKQWWLFCTAHCCKHYICAVSEKIFT